MDHDDLTKTLTLCDVHTFNRFVIIYIYFQQSLLHLSTYDPKTCFYDFLLYNDFFNLKKPCYDLSMVYTVSLWKRLIKKRYMISCGYGSRLPTVTTKNLEWDFLTTFDHVCKTTL